MPDPHHHPDNLLPVCRPVGTVTPDVFEECFGEPLTNRLNLETWRPGVNLVQ
jgi:hypothetical protein